MLKGSDDITAAFSVIIFVMVVGTLIALLYNQMLSVSAKISTSKDELEIVDIAHLVRGCFAGNSTAINATLFGQNRNADVSRMCGIQRSGIFVRLKDLETRQEWTIGDEKNAHAHSIFVPILNNNKVDLGELNVRI